MSNIKIEKILLAIVRCCIYLTIITPLILSAAFFFPAIFPKMVFIRILVEAAVIAYLPLLWLSSKYRPKFHVVFLALAVFAAVVVIASIWGVNFSYSFWGNYERMDGIFSWLHFWVLIVIASSVFRQKRDWQKLFSASIVVALIMAVYGFLQRTGVSHFGPWPVYETNADRITGTIGNPGFFAIYLLFNITFAINLIIDKDRNNTWRVFGAVSILVLGVAFLMTGIRGAFWGLVAALIFFVVLYSFWTRKHKIKRWVLSVFSILLVLVAVLFFFRHTAAISNSSLIGRYFNTSISDPTVQTRLVSWRGALSGASEHLLLGVGPQKFDVIFNKYFDPRFYSLVGTETWWDRAHNMILEVLATMGIIGLLSYLSVGLAILYSFWKLGQKEPESKVESLLWMSFFMLYFIQNLFIFDSTTSYLMLSLAIAYAVSRSDETTRPFPFLLKWKSIINKIKFGEPVGGKFLIFILAIFFVVGFAAYQTNIKLIKHNRLLLSNLSGNENRPFSAALNNYRRIFDLTDFDQREVAIKLGQFMGQYPFVHKMTIDEMRGGFNFTLRQMEKALAANPSDVRLLLSYGNTANVYGELIKSSSPKESESVLRKAERALLEAVALGQSRQQVFYSLANTYLIGGNINKAVEVLEDAVELNTDTPATYWFLSVAYIQAGEKEKAIVAADTALDKKYAFNNEKEGHFITSLYLEKKDYDRLLRLYKEIAQQTGTGTSQARLAALYAQMGKKDEALAAAKKVIERDPSLQSQVLEFIREVESGVKKDYLSE